MLTIPASPLARFPSPLRGGSPAEAERRRAGWGEKQSEMPFAVRLSPPPDRFRCAEAVDLPPPGGGKARPLQRRSLRRLRGPRRRAVGDNQRRDVDRYGAQSRKLTHADPVEPAMTAQPASRSNLHDPRATDSASEASTRASSFDVGNEGFIYRVETIQGDRRPGLNALNGAV